MAAVYPELRGLTSIAVHHAVDDDDRTVNWAMEHGLIAGSRVCRCGGQMITENCVGECFC